MNRYNKDIFGEAPDRFINNLDRALGMGEEKVKRKSKVTVALIAALVLLIGATAFAIIQSYWTETISDVHFPQNTELVMGSDLAIVDSQISEGGNVILSCYKNNSPAYTIASQVEGWRISGEWFDKPLDSVVKMIRSDGEEMWTHTFPPEERLRQYQIVGMLPDGETLLRTAITPDINPSLYRPVLINADGDEIDPPESWSALAESARIWVDDDLMLVLNNTMPEEGDSEYVPSLSLYRFSDLEVSELWNRQNSELAGVLVHDVLFSEKGLVLYGSYWKTEIDSTQVFGMAAILAESDGSIEWKYRYDEADSAFYAAYVEKDGDYMIGGYVANGDVWNAALLRFDPNGVLLWEKDYAEVSAHLISDIKEIDNGFAVISTAGVWESPVYLIMQLNKEGEINGIVGYTPERYKSGYPKMQQDTDGAIVVMGSVDDNIGRFASDSLFISKLNAESFMPINEKRN